MSSPDIEGPHLYKIEGWYYLMCAEGGTRFGHSETIARSKSPWGPWEKCPHNPILTHRNLSGHDIRDTGHAELVDASDGSWWLFCLGTRHRDYDSASFLGRETLMAPVAWTTDGWPVVGEAGKVPTSFEGPALAAHIWPAKELRDNFDQKDLSLCWNFLRNPYSRDWSLVARPGFLRLHGSAISLNDLDSPAFVGRRQEQFESRAMCAVEFEPAAENEEAGLTILLTNSYHFECAITRRNNARVAVVKKQVGDMVCEVGCVPLKTGKIVLAIEASPKEYRFLAGNSESELNVVASGMPKLLSPELAGFCWTGVYWGMYATGNGKPCSTPADFDFFEYQP